MLCDATRLDGDREKDPRVESQGTELILPHNMFHSTTYANPHQNTLYQALSGGTLEQDLNKALHHTLYSVKTQQLSPFGLPGIPKDDNLFFREAYLILRSFRLQIHVF